MSGQWQRATKAVEAYECAGSMRAVLNDEQAVCLCPAHSSS